MLKVDFKKLLCLLYVERKLLLKDGVCNRMLPIECTLQSSYSYLRGSYMVEGVRSSKLHKMSCIAITAARYSFPWYIIKTREWLFVVKEGIIIVLGVITGHSSYNFINFIGPLNLKSLPFFWQKNLLCTVWSHVSMNYVCIIPETFSVDVL